MRKERPPTEIKNLKAEERPNPNELPLKRRFSSQEPAIYSQ